MPKINQNRLLIIEKSDDSYQKILEDLNKSNIKNKVYRADSLYKSVKFIKKNEFDLILINFNLKDVDGLTALNSLNEIIKIPIISYGGPSDQSIADKIISIGAKDYISENQLKKINMHRVVKCTLEKHRLKKDLLRTKDFADRTSKFKNEFLAHMSHEIRTPMNGIAGMISLLVNTNLNDEQKELVDIIKRSGDNLINVINDILDLSEIESGKVKIHHEKFNIRDLVEDVVDLYGDLAYKKNISITNLVEDNIPKYVSGDAIRLRQILSNLIANAIKFTNKGYIIIRVFKIYDSKKLYFEVIDTGIGIPKTSISKLFQPFKSVNYNHCSILHGAGLGLSICQKLTKLMGGEINVKSKFGEGSVFSFYIETKLSGVVPKDTIKKYYDKKLLIINNHKDINGLLQNIFKKNTNIINCFKAAIDFLNKDKSIDLIILVLNKKICKNSCIANIIKLSKYLEIYNAPVLLITNNYYKNTLEFNLNKDYIKFPIKQSDLHQKIDKLFSKNKNEIKNIKKENNFKYNILVVDDNSVNLKVANKILSKLGHNIFLAIDGSEAIIRAKQDIFDIIFMDYKMPGIDGIEATKEIRKLENENSNTVIIALTANALTGKDKCLKGGMNDFLEKPVSFDLIKNMISKWLNDKPKQQNLNLDMIIDKKIIDSIINLDGTFDISFLHELIDIFNQQGPDILKSLINAMRDNKIRDIEFHSHKLKGMSQNLGSKQLAFLCSDIEKKSSDKNPLKWEKEIDLIQKYYENFYNEIIKYKKQTAA